MKIMLTVTTLATLTLQRPTNQRGPSTQVVKSEPESLTGLVITISLWMKQAEWLLNHKPPRQQTNMEN